MKKLNFLSPAIILTLLLFTGCDGMSDRGKDNSDKIVVLTFDDAVKSHLSFVAPLLKELNFDATFFVTYKWMEDSVHFLNWDEIRQLHDMGFEIGNHSWTHPDFSQPANAAELEGELGLMNWELMTHEVPRPVSFAYSGNGFGPEAIKILSKMQIKYARRGMQPEVPYGTMEPGPVFNPGVHHHLLIPTTRDAYPDMTLEDFKKAVNKAGKNKIAVLQFHGVPDEVHPWVTTEPQMFKNYMYYLKNNGFQVIAMRGLAPYLPADPPADTLSNYRYTLGDPENLNWPSEVVSTRQNLDFWISNMQAHHYTMEEMMAVTAMGQLALEPLIKNTDPAQLVRRQNGNILVLPYPGSRHPRIGFQEGMLSPMRGTKASIFLPDHPGQYLVLDLPEAVFTQLGLTFLGHKHIPTYFDLKKISIENSDWQVHDDGHLTNQWDLPINLTIGSEIYPRNDHVDMELWLRNSTRDTTFTGLQTQICIMLKEIQGFNVQTNENKVLECPSVAVHSSTGNDWVITGWEGCSHPWGNADCPCMHADPKFPDCAPGETVRLQGHVWFYSGKDVSLELERLKKKI